jgi:hypothetical protein
MNHPNEQELVLAYFEEVVDPELRQHLAECAECTAAMEQLSRTLALIDEETLPQRDATYGAAMWQRVRWQLPAQRRERPWWLFAAAAVVLLVVGYLAGRETHPAVPSAPAVAAIPAKRATATPTVNGGGADAVLTAAASEQIERSTRLLVEVANHEGGDASTPRDTAEELLASSRIYRVAAGDRGAEEVAQLLNEIEPILLELVHAPDDIPADELAVIQQRIESRELLFKLRVVAATLRARERERQQQNINPSLRPATL